MSKWRPEEWKRTIDRSEVVSFDLFDTLLVRPYVKPRDLFRHLEYLENDPGFARRRSETERKIRMAAPSREIDFETIYKESALSSKITADRELAMEKSILAPRLVMKELFDYAKEQHKKIILISDMYFSSAVLADILSNAGYSGWYKIYVSSEWKVSKGRGKLYRAVLRDLGIKPSAMVHFGDNLRSDVMIPRLLGIRSVYCPKQIVRYFAKNPREKIFYRQNRDELAASITLALCARRDEEYREKEGTGRYWSDLGYRTGGPACYGYCRYIEQEAKKDGVHELMFAARDGWTLQKIFDLFSQSDIHTSYVYAPRFLNYLLTLDCENHTFSQLKEVLDYYQQNGLEVDPTETEKLHTYQELREFFHANRENIEPIRRKIEQQYADYLQAHTQNSGSLGVVDVVTSRFTSTVLISRAFLGKEIFSYIWGFLKIKWVKTDTFPYRAYCGKTKNFFDPKVFSKDLEFLEFIMTAPEPPVQMLSADGHPIRREKIAPEEKIRMKVYQSVSAGEIQFAEDIIAVFQNQPISFPSKWIIRRINSFLNWPTREDKKRFLPIEHAMDPAHTQYRPMMICRPKLREFLSGKWTLVRYFKAIWFTPWRTPLQTMFNWGINMLMPIYVWYFRWRFKIPKNIQNQDKEGNR